MEHDLKKWIRAAGEIALANFRLPREDGGIQAKGVQDVVTKTDFAIDQFFHREIKKRYPDDDVFSEETDHADLFSDRRTWVIDPIDGTGNFSAGIPVFAISVGIIERGLPVMGVIYDPFSKEYFFAKWKGGAFLNNAPIHTSFTSHLSQSIVVKSSAHGKDSYEHSERIGSTLRNKTFKLFRTECNSLMLAYVACGRIDACYSVGNTPPWDSTAGALLVSEAGGLVTDAEGRPWRVGFGPIVGSNTRVHLELLKYFS